ncbi:MAG TPA: putative DNA binding domain-containing protein [Bacteroidales bacterium]|nr:putative DNA binding domain-containing protein [Bacteroidales bacterium]HSA43825.1 putative DNA binding domain-containing protein [Bacteroidales bacterium]
MTEAQIRTYLSQGEGLRIEFKKSRLALPGNLFESVCSFLNHSGGTILLGVDNDGSFEGVDRTTLDKLMDNVATLSNNPEFLDPPFLLFPIKHEIDGENIIVIQVPESSQVHKFKGIVFDRSRDGDFKVIKPERIAEIANRKRNLFTEGRILPFLEYKHFREDLFEKARALIRSRKPDHPWLLFDNPTLLEKAGLYKTDLQTGEVGYTLAALLLFGRNEFIESTLPALKIDALVRIENTDRYDDRDEIRHTNLIEAYERLMAFVGKHLPDKFHLENGQNVSLRDIIFREVIANILVHREYTHAMPTTFVIYQDRVETLNPNNPHFHGLILPEKVVPFPKNPAISKFFIQLGRVEELGSGVMNVSKYLPHYTQGALPQFIENDVFTTIIPLKVHTLGALAKEFLRAILPGHIQAEEVLTLLTSLQITSEIAKEAHDPGLLFYRLGVCWMEKGLKLLRDKDHDISKLTKEEEIKGLSWEEKGTKLIEKGLLNMVQILILCLREKSLQELADITGYSNRSKYKSSYIDPLVNYRLIELTIPDKPKSPAQKYKTTVAGRYFLGGGQI